MNTSSHDLDQYGIFDSLEVVRNPSFEILFAEATAGHLKGYEKGQLTESGAVSVDTRMRQIGSGL